ncbi:hypothetical protein BC831DRAFT_451592 [Entophlyctis helioformis]|nr:hypothetical protein BC831DRAFT_451592 [Entophlyctis helioformis]
MSVNPAAAAAAAAAAQAQAQAMASIFRPGGLDNGRYFNAFLTFAGLLCGLGLHEMAASAIFLMSKPKKAWNTALFRLAALSWLFTAAYLALYIIFIDYRISLYKTDEDWYRNRFVALMVSGGLAATCLFTMLLVRLRMFFENPRSVSFIALSAFGGLTIISFLTFSAAAPTWPSRKTVSILAAIAHIAQGIFSTVCSVTFLYSIAKAVGLSNKTFFTEVFLQHEGGRFLAIILLCLFTSACHIYIAINKNGPDNYIVYTSYYTDTWLFPLELFTFLSTSYVSAKEIVEKHTKGLTPGSAFESSQMQSQIASPVDSINKQLPPPAPAKLSGGDSAIGQPQLVYGSYGNSNMYSGNTYGNGDVIGANLVANVSAANDVDMYGNNVSANNTFSANMSSDKSTAVNDDPYNGMYGAPAPPKAGESEDYSYAVQQQFQQYQQQYQQFQQFQMFQEQLKAMQQLQEQLQQQLQQQQQMMQMQSVQSPAGMQQIQNLQLQIKEQENQQQQLRASFGYGYTAKDYLNYAQNMQQAPGSVNGSTTGSATNVPTTNISMKGGAPQRTGSQRSNTQYGGSTFGSSAAATGAAPQPPIQVTYTPETSNVPLNDNGMAANTYGSQQGNATNNREWF